jgi:hypothetical protein
MLLNEVLIRVQSVESKQVNTRIALWELNFLEEICWDVNS